MRCFFIMILLVLMNAVMLGAVDQRLYVSNLPVKDAFPLTVQNHSAPLVISSNDYKGVLTMAGHLQTDIERVTGVKPGLIQDDLPETGPVVLIGTLGRCQHIDKLVRENKINVAGIAGRWDTFLLQTVKHPFPGIDQALVIAGSNKRATFYGMFDLSAQIGVSPWNWWADVPVAHQAALYVLPGRHTAGTPAVKYRGIFLNDEEPALGRWAVENFGGFYSGFYEKLFQLMLRLKANYLWPAMWWASFNTDDPVNPELADEYGIVMGTTHHEPMNRAHAEWRATGKGPWNYEKNGQRLREFWRQGIERMHDYETIVTVGMRGDGDKAMSDETNIALLERIVKDQRQIIEDVTGKDAAETPQLWALYKEVQAYYDQGMRVPDDVTLLLCDDNWGNIRKLPKLSDAPRSGGYGIYYHFDYVGGPRNYKWLNTTQIERVWEQMHLAYEYGVDRIWLVNVGDLKPMEFPIEFFLDYAWDPGEWPAERLPEYTREWVKNQFGPDYAQPVAEIIDAYTQFNSRRKPELLSAQTYSLHHYCEFERIVGDYNQIAEKARMLYKKMPASMQPAFYQLVLHPVKACANLNDMYYTVGLNRLYAEQGRALTNTLAEKVQTLFAKDTSLSYYYNKELLDGKWNNMMNQTHISYTYWQQPEKDVPPEVETLDLPERADLGVSVAGTDSWSTGSRKLALPEFDSVNRQSFYIELFNRGRQPLECVIETPPWICVTEFENPIETQERVWVIIDWEKVPEDVTTGQVLVICGKNSVRIDAPVRFISNEQRQELVWFY
ncbi:MAG: glycosyl hydrolase 115 family protein [candidate division KSB1 bacterium]|nr:glycosyl hydrolase 115 family protein [candidate division KSB1 bacterium]